MPVCVQLLWMLVAHAMRRCNLLSESVGRAKQCHDIEVPFMEYCSRSCVGRDCTWLTMARSVLLLLVVYCMRYKVACAVSVEWSYFSKAGIRESCKRARVPARAPYLTVQ